MPFQDRRRCRSLTLVLLHWLNSSLSQNFDLMKTFKPSKSRGFKIDFSLVPEKEDKEDSKVRISHRYLSRSGSCWSPWARTLKQMRDCAHHFRYDFACWNVNGRAVKANAWLWASFWMHGHVLGLGKKGSDSSDSGCIPAFPPDIWPGMLHGKHCFVFGHVKCFFVRERGRERERRKAMTMRMRRHTMRMMWTAEILPRARRRRRMEERGVRVGRRTKRRIVHKMTEPG